MPGTFDTLIDEIDHDLELRARALAKAMVAGADGDLSSSQDAILATFRIFSDKIKELARKIDHLSGEVSLKNNLKRPAASPPHPPGVVDDDEAPAEMTKAFGRSAHAFMAKALHAQRAGRLTGVQVATAEAAINLGKTPPADIVRAVIEQVKS